MSDLARFQYGKGRASCEVRMECGHITMRDRVLSAELWGNMTAEDALTMFAKTLHCAQRAAYDIHAGETVSVHITRKDENE